MTRALRMPANRAGAAALASAIWLSTLRAQPSGCALTQMKPRERWVTTCADMKARFISGILGRRAARVPARLSGGQDSTTLRGASGEAFGAGSSPSRPRGCHAAQAASPEGTTGNAGKTTISPDVSTVAQRAFPVRQTGFDPFQEVVLHRSTQDAAISRWTGGNECNTRGLPHLRKETKNRSSQRGSANFTRPARLSFGHYEDDEVLP